MLSLSSLFSKITPGVVAKTAIAPAERVKMSFQVSNEKFTLTSAFERGRYIASHEGPLRLWRGHSTTILRIAPYAGTVTYVYVCM